MWIVTACQTDAAQGTMTRAAGPVPVLNRFVKVDAIDFKGVLPAPPPPGSIAEQAEIMTLLQMQEWRTADHVSWARLIETDSVYNLSAILGAGFKPNRLPLTAVLFKQIGEDLRAMDSLAKKPFARPRPSSVEPRLQPCVTLPASTSYPSGSATQALVWAEVLGEAIPAHRDELIARAHRAAWGRVIGGVHYPSDLVAGQLLARYYLAECRKSPKFKEAFAACREEVVAASAAGK
jgi:acid phosphatase (class A)